MDYVATYTQEKTYGECRVSMRCFVLMLVLERSRHNAAAAASAASVASVQKVHQLCAQLWILESSQGTRFELPDSFARHAKDVRNFL